MKRVTTQFHQKEMPPKIEKDKGENLLSVGSKVAYNYSGEVVIGTLQEITKNRWKISRKGVGDKRWWNHQFEAKILNEDGVNVSRIRNINSMIII